MSIRIGLDEDGEFGIYLLSLSRVLSGTFVERALADFFFSFFHFVLRSLRYVQLLLAVAGLSRVVEWWEAEKGFWNFAPEGNEDVEPLHFVIKDSRKVTSPAAATTVSSPPAKGGFPSSASSGLGLGLGGAAGTKMAAPQFSSIGIRLDSAEPLALQLQHDGERTAMLPKLEVPDTTEDLRTQVEQAKNVNMVLELSLDGEFVEWINPAWREVVG